MMKHSVACGRGGTQIILSWRKKGGCYIAQVAIVDLEDFEYVPSRHDVVLVLGDVVGS